MISITCSLLCVPELASLIFLSATSTIYESVLYDSVNKYGEYGCT